MVRLRWLPIRPVCPHQPLTTPSPLPAGKPTGILWHWLSHWLSHRPAQFDLPPPARPARALLILLILLILLMPPLPELREPPAWQQTSCMTSLPLHPQWAPITTATDPSTTSTPSTCQHLPAPTCPASTSASIAVRPPRRHAATLPRRHAVCFAAVAITASTRTRDGTTRQYESLL
jgi:hypothetical protein